MYVEDTMRDAAPLAVIEDEWTRFLQDIRAGSAAGGSALPAAARSEAKKTADPKRVLIVEDNIDAVRSLAYLVRDMGHFVEYAINGYVAIDIARRFLPDIVLLDLGLPGMDGFEVCRKIKSHAGLEQTRVIAITGYAQDEYRMRSRAAGCEMHLIKPVPTGVLEQLLG
jgi:CheY-like chemotaxis protein